MESGIGRLSWGMLRPAVFINLLWIISYRSLSIDMHEGAGSWVSVGRGGKLRKVAGGLLFMRQAIKIGD